MVLRKVALIPGVFSATVLVLLGCGAHQHTQAVKHTYPQPMPLATRASLEPLPLLELPPEVVYFTHKVRWSGETLIAMARWYTGSGGNWKQLRDANPSVNPNVIRIGTTILIPEDILKTRRRMPKKPIPRPAVGKRKPPPAPEATSLFGPIEDKVEDDKTINSLDPPPLETID